MGGSAVVVTERLRQIKGVGALTALTFVLTLDDPHRFTRSRSVGAYLGLVPASRSSGNSAPQLPITKHGDRLLRRLLVQAAHYILGPFGQDSDLRSFGLELARRGGKSGKKRAVVAVARKLAVLLHRLWVSGETYDPHRRQPEPREPRRPRRERLERDLDAGDEVLVRHDDLGDAAAGALARVPDRRKADIWPLASDQRRVSPEEHLARGQQRRGMAPTRREQGLGVHPSASGHVIQPRPRPRGCRSCS